MGLGWIPWRHPNELSCLCIWSSRGWGLGCFWPRMSQPSYFIFVFKVQLCKPRKVAVFAKLLKAQDVVRQPLQWRPVGAPCYSLIRSSDDNTTSADHPRLCCFLVAIATKGKSCHYRQKIMLLSPVNFLSQRRYSKFWVYQIINLRKSRVFNRVKLIASVVVVGAWSSPDKHLPTCLYPGLVCEPGVVCPAH